MRFSAINGDGFPRAVNDGVVSTREWERKKTSRQTYNGKVPKDMVLSTPCEVRDGKVVRVNGVSGK